MRKRTAGGAIIALALLTSIFPAWAFEPLPAPLPARGTVQAAFAPWNDIEGLITAAIGDAKQQVLVQAYLLTSKEMTQALIHAQHRGVDVRVLMDAGQLDKVPASQALTLAAAGIPVWLETGYQNAHNKIVIIDSSSAAPVLITGSFNFTWSAAHKNAENVLVVRGDSRLASLYRANWERHRQDATAYPH